MKKQYLAILAAVFAASPSLAQSEDWWLVSGEPGESTVQFIDAASIDRNAQIVSFNTAIYWNNGRTMDRKLKMNCDQKPVEQSYADLWAFACGSEETRMSKALMLGSTDPKWLATTVFAMPS